MNTRQGLLFIFSLLLVVSADAKKQKTRKPSSFDRPPQFVLLAFDGSKDIAFWDESYNFADTVTTMDGERKLRFTYFINPTYYLSPQNKRVYDTPGLGPGHSCIGWSNAAADIPARIARTNKAFEAGHEIGSHANAHCDQTGVDKNDPMYGHPWGENEWSSEFSQFNHLLFDAFSINRVSPSSPGAYGNGFSFQQKDIVGFRAPKLAYTNGLWPTLQKFNFRYDTSMASPPDYWPQRMSWGGWKFPLAQIKIAGTTRKVLSMDYNWLFFHSAGASKPGLTNEERTRWYNQVMDSYKYYFKKNYFGNRAPVHIGHHFSKWNGGLYWSAMQDFAKFVCNKPEVRCVTYTEYANWLDGLDNSTYEAYRTGQFQRLPDDGVIKDIATPILADIRLDSDAKQFEAVVADADRTKVKALGWKPQLQVDFEAQADTKITREQLAKKYKPDSSFTVRASLINRSGAEMNWQTYRVKNFGTKLESIDGPLEDRTLQGEAADAHEE